ncbi:MAG: DNA polymerase III subunit delta' [Beijerinckiaceae bacterium]
MSDDVLADQLEDYPHPREAAALFGHAQAEQQFLDAYRSGRLHHAWIIAGPEGIGKATLAYRIAKFLFAYPRPELAAGATDLSVPENHPAFTRVAAQGHADLFVLRRTYGKDGKKVRTEIAVDDARGIIDRFWQTSGEGGWRVCIVDAADEWNRNVANALLKTLEEPPKRTIFLVVAHHAGRLLPTIRSRSRLLPLQALGDAAMRQAINSVASGAQADAVDEAIAGANGSVRRALMLLDRDIAAIGTMTRALLDKLPQLDTPGIMSLAEAVAGRAKDDAFAEFEHVLRAWMSQAVEARAGQGAGAVTPLAELWDMLGRGLATTDAYNLDRKPFILALFSDMAEAMKRLRAA